MRLRFNGIIEKRTKGCHSCGSRHTDTQLVMRKLYILPSGNRITFRVGQSYDLEDEDAAFLLGYKYTDSNGIHQVFEHDYSAGN